MTAITPELRQAIEQAGGDPVQITDPETQAAYVIVKAEVYERHACVVRRLRRPGFLPDDERGSRS